MRIQNNITAMNTHRQYTINNDNVAKAAEKLSSGYRINRAADDAAGLAISEKMRSQIRGLNMATKNSQDAISLVQTAEGALQETHSMLQRMNELAVQAATGTNQEFDRTQAAKEFNQLKREINDIAEQTTFNNMKILDGSLSYEGYVRSAQTAGVTNTASEVEKDGAITGIQTDPYKAGTQGAAETMSFTLSAADLGKVMITDNGTTLTLGAAQSITLAAFDADGNTDTSKDITVSIVANATTGLTADGSNKKISDVLAVDPDLLDITVTGGDGRTYEGAIDATGKITLTEKPAAGTDFEGPSEDVAKYTYNANDITPSGAVAGPQTGTTPSAEKTTATIDVDKLKVGDKIQIGDYKYEVVANGKAGTVAAGTNAIELGTDGKINAATLETKLKGGTNAAGTTASTDYTISIAGKLLTVEQQNEAPNDAAHGPSGDDSYRSTKVTFGDPTDKSKSEYKNTLEFDTTKMKDGDVFQFNVGGKTATVTFDSEKYQSKADQTANEAFAAAVATALNDAGANVTAKGNAVLYTGKKIGEGDIKLTDVTKGADKAAYPTNAIRIQVGALEDEQLAVSIDAMNTAGLELDGFNLDSQNEAGMAITAVRKAVNKVSDQRATLGAMQNRLDHKIANLKVSSENLSAAESRIRDVDMASEMTNFTKNNILSQAATAMLAQANALPQNVLSLLG